MKNIFGILALCMFSFAYAGDNNGPTFGGNTTNINQNTLGQTQTQAQLTNVRVGVNTNITNDVRSNATAFANSKSNSLSVATGGNAHSNATGGSAVGYGGQSTSDAYSGGNQQSVTVTDSGQMRYSGSYEVKNVPNVYSGDIHPTSPCMGSSSMGGAGVGFGFSIGSSWTDDECGIRETARSFAGMGMKDDALAILCSSKYAAVAPACKKE